MVSWLLATPTSSASTRLGSMNLWGIFMNNLRVLPEVSTLWLFLKSIPIPKKSTQTRIWLSLKYPMGDTRTGNWTGRLYQMNFGCNCREAAARLLVMAAIGSGLLAGGLFLLLAFLAEKAPWSCILVSSSTSPSTLLPSLLSLSPPSPSSKTWARGEDSKREWEDSVEIMN